MKLTISRQLIFCLIILVAAAFATQAQQWSLVRQTASGGDLITIFFADGKRGWVAGDKGFLAWTNDGGKTWTQQQIATNEDITDIYFRGSDKGFLVAGDKIFATTDGGATWREEQMLINDVAEGKPSLTSLRFADKRNGWIVGGIVGKNGAFLNSLVLHAGEKDGIWRRVRSIETREELIHLDFVDDKRGWIVGTNGTIFATADGGNTWNKQNAGTNANLYHVDFKNKSLGWVVGGNGTILRTENGGATWEKIDAKTTRALRSVEFINDKIGFVVGRAGTILRSDDGGRTWTQQDGKTSENLFGLYVDKKVSWAVGGKGTILRFDR
jgi:photosystem II stability/assembly factor-like uncharacterized protein